jgi:hypothetical protein
MIRIYQWLQIVIAMIFIILTLGFISVELEWNNGSKFRYSGWKIRRRGK